MHSGNHYLDNLQFICIKIILGFDLHFRKWSKRLNICRIRRARTYDSQSLSQDRQILDIGRHWENCHNHTAQPFDVTLLIITNLVSSICSVRCSLFWNLLSWWNSLTFLFMITVAWIHCWWSSEIAWVYWLIAQLIVLWWITTPWVFWWCARHSMIFLSG